MDQSDLQAFSCVTCRQRKVKCDRRNPCSNCTKADKPCSFIAPVRGKRKRAKPPREGLHAKLKRYEDLLKACGVQIEPSEDGEDTDSEAETTSRPDFEVTRHAELQAKGSNDLYGLDEASPKLITVEDETRYLDSGSSVLWSNLGREFTSADVDGLHTPLDHLKLEETDILFKSSNVQNNVSKTLDLASLHPPDQILSKLQEIYIDRVDSIIKILHLPTFWPRVKEVYQAPRDVSKSLQALVFSFYLATIMTLRDDECLKMLGAQKLFLHDRYRLATQQALIEADVLSTSNPMTLQAYALFVMGVKDTYQVDTLYVFTGVAIRLARKMGLHRDGSSLGLSPFESEMRRRLWWHIAHLDFKMSESLDARPSMDLFICDVKMPSNVADEDYSPESVTMPPERNAITPIVICMIRCEIVEFLRKLCSTSPNHIRLEILGSPDIPLAKKDSLIREYENKIEQKYLRYCDPTNALHVLVSIMARATICRFKLMAHDPWRRAGGGDKVHQSDRDVVFVSASKLLEYATMVPGNSFLEKYMWQTSMIFICNNLLYVLIEARHRKTGPEIDRVWQLIGVVLSKYPQILGTSGAVYNALRKWILEVWDDYAAARRVARLPDPSIPEYITALQHKLRPQIEAKSHLDFGTDLGHIAPILVNDEGVHAHRQNGNFLNDSEPLASYDFPDILSFEMNPNDWLQWEQLVAEEGSGF